MSTTVVVLRGLRMLTEQRRLVTPAYWASVNTTQTPGWTPVDTVQYPNWVVDGVAIGNAPPLPYP